MRMPPLDMAMECRMDSRVRRNEPIWRYVVASCVVLCLTSTGRGQAVETRPSPTPGEMVDNEGSGEGRSATEAIEAEDFIETDRNSFTFARVAAGANRLIVESSFSYINITGEKVKFSFPETLLRYGIGERFELRLGWNYETGRERVPGAGNIAGFFAANAEQQIYYGF
jgi:hypothetical protein